jgi:hypothetical protein
VSRGKSRRSLELIEASIEILREIQPASVRAVCYRLFAEGFIDSMAKSETNKVGRQLTYARERGLIEWSWVVDETRRVEVAPSWADPERFAKSVTRGYRRNKWAGQPVRIEVWSEKGTVRGTLAPVLDTYEVPFRVMHGYASATTVHDAARESLRDERPWIVLYCGDWDASGLHMSTVDLPMRLREYRWRLGQRDEVGIGFTPDTNFNIYRGWPGGPPVLELNRVALTAEDVGPDLPSFDLDTKSGDPRHNWYRDDAGYRQCWELDAMSPVRLRDRVEAAIVARLDHSVWERYVEAEQVERASIEATVRTWRGLMRTPA